MSFHEAVQMVEAISHGERPGKGVSRKEHRRLAATRGGFESRQVHSTRCAFGYRIERSDRVVWLGGSDRPMCRVECIEVSRWSPAGEAWPGYVCLRRLANDGRTAYGPRFWVRGQDVDGRIIGSSQTQE